MQGAHDAWHAARRVAAANAARLEACPPPRPDPDAESCADLLDTMGEHLIERGLLSPAPIERKPY